ncbi:hypothetical protein GH5_08254 [Leishmania sp. Ghana 2012 LV757]|uniref:hypothetical protein n=1 Tax=Leishmania sp. Ghana 2012 LV757 TaxID=2803181 RepID=UPI001B50B21A|nr:hypothetical protein GH5_08254 [Leishmania sp. Ghana 2012 LV757]
MPITVSPARPTSAVQLAPMPGMGARRPLTATTMSTLQSASKAVAATPPSSSSASPFRVFAELPDQLLCSPDNSVWVYGRYVLSLFTPEATAQARLERKVRSMMQEAQRHYTISCAFFHSLTSEEQMAEVLRVSGGGGTPSPPPSMTTAAMATGTSAKRDLGRNVDGTGAEKIDHQRLAGVHRELRGMWPTWGASDMNDAPNDLSTREVRGPNDDEPSQNYYAAGLRVNLVVDIVASRKTIGPEPLRSRPYRLAKNLYQRIMRSATAQPTESSLMSTRSVGLCTPVTAAGMAHMSIDGVSAPKAAVGRGWDNMAPHVRSLVIGISDSETTLVGCHLVCPYRHLSSPTPMLMRLRRAIEAAAEQERARALAATAATTTAPVGGIDAQGQGSAVVTARDTVSSPLCSVVASQLGRYGCVDALLAASCVRAPPQSLGHIDQSRLILCSPGTFPDA